MLDSHSDIYYLHFDKIMIKAISKDLGYPLKIWRYKEENQTYFLDLSGQSGTGRPVLGLDKGN